MLMLTLLLWNLLAIGSCSTGPEPITAEPGQNITLPCRAADNRPVVVVEWSRTDLGSDYVLLYRDDQLDPELQHPSYQNRVDLNISLLKDGDVSLVLKKVTINDTGSYECRVFYDEPDSRKKLITTTHLSVRSPGDEEGGGDHVGDSRGLLGLIALPVLAVIIAAAAVVVYLWKKKKKKTPPPDSASQEKQMEASDLLKRKLNGGNMDLGNDNEGNQDGRTEDGD